MAAIYIIPAHYFLSFLHSEGIGEIEGSWVNRFISMDELGDRWRVMLALAAMWLYALALAIAVIVRHRAIGDPVQRREIFAWGAVMAFAMCVHVIFHQRAGMEPA